jgi:hypothetical protein
MWRTWVAWMDRREDALPLACVRIIVGLAIAGHLAHLLAVGAPALLWVDVSQGGVRALNNPLVDAIGGPTPETIAWLVPATLVAALLTALGVLTKVSVFATWFGYRALGDLNSHAGGSYDELIENILFLLLLSGCGGRLSLDARFGLARRVVPAWPRYVMVLQLAWMYVATALQKLSIHWVPWGELDALWYILQQPTWQRIPMTWLWPFFPLTRLATLGTWAFEITSPLLPLSLYFRATRTRAGRLRAILNRVDWRSRYLFVGVLMHIGIESTMEVGPFAMASLALYFACFHPDEYPGWLRRYGSTSSTSSPAS